MQSQEFTTTRVFRRRCLAKCIKWYKLKVKLFQMVARVDKLRFPWVCENNCIVQVNDAVEIASVKYLGIIGKVIMINDKCKMLIILY